MSSTQSLTEPTAEFISYKNNLAAVVDSTHTDERQRAISSDHQGKARNIHKFATVIYSHSNALLQLGVLLRLP